jgi:hypothetical protein
MQMSRTTPILAAEDNAIASVPAAVTQHTATADVTVIPSNPAAFPLAQPSYITLPLKGPATRIYFNIYCITT